MTWQNAVDIVKPHVVKLATTDGHGTGFLVHRRDDWVVIATAKHVVTHAHNWGLPIRVDYQNLAPLTLTAVDRTLLLHPEQDSAVLVWKLQKSVAASLPVEPLPLLGDKSFVRTGVTIGWLGYPHLVEGGTRCCFFSGSISDFIRPRYFVDGVAINGVSGGPAFCPDKDGNITIVGSISEYWLNQQDEKSLPGIMVANDISASNVLAQAMDGLLQKLAPTG